MNPDRSESTKYRLGDLQLAIMRVLWRRGEAAVATVYEALREERGLAPTTVATMLVKMEKKGVVTHRTEGRKFIYLPQVSESAVRRSMVAELGNRLFQGNTTAFVNHLLAEHDLDADELERVKTAIAAKEGK